MIGTVAEDKEAKTLSGSKKKRKAAAEDEELPGPTSKTKRLESTANGSIDKAHNRASSPAEAAATPEPVKSKVKRRKEKAGERAAVDSKESKGTGPGEEGQKQKIRVVHIVAAAEAPSLAQFKATPRSGWWGASRFASAGESISAFQSFLPPCACSARSSCELAVCSTYFLVIWCAWPCCLVGLTHTADLAANSTSVRH